VNATPAPKPKAKSTPATADGEVLFGRFMLPDMTEHPCQVKNLSIEGAIFITDQLPRGGTQVVSYIDNIGRVEAISAEAVPGGFRVIFTHAGARRDRFAARLTWSHNKEGEMAPEQRRHARYEVPERVSHITLPDGRVYPCEVIDISISGAAVKVDVMPSLGTYVTLGKMRGRIVRYHNNGVAMEFVKPLDRDDLTEELQRKPHS
jgi:hypothetical protein